MNHFRWLCCCALGGLVACGPFSRHAAAQRVPREDNPFGQLVQVQPTPTGPTLPVPATPAPPRPAAPPVRDDQPAAAADGAMCHCVGESAAEKRIKAALAAPLHANGLTFEKPPLEEVVNELQLEYGIPIQLDRPSLERAALSPDEPVTINVHGVSLRSGLRLMLKQLQLTYIIREEVLMITTPESAEELLRICMYDVRDLVGAEVGMLDFESLIDAIQSTVLPEAWAATGGGPGDIRALPNGLLIVSQTEALHEEVRDLLQTMRQAIKRPPAGSAVNWRPPAGRLVTRSYGLKIAQPEDAEGYLRKLHDLIVSLVPDQSWDDARPDGQQAVLSVLPDRVVVRHRESVQRQVEKVLKDISVLAPSTPGRQMPVGFRGGGGFFSPGDGKE